MMQNRVSTPPLREDQFKKRGFWALVATQFQGAFNDNLYQYIIIFYLLSLFRDVPQGAEEYRYFGYWPASTFVPAFANFLFALPFIIFPGIFGALADRFSKQRLAVATKWLEICVMTLGGIAFYLGYTPLIWGILFLMATQSALFGPAKYGILPEILPSSRLSWGNGVIQMGTIIAIIAGMGLAGPLFLKIQDHIYFASLVLVSLSAIGIATSYFITRPPAANPNMSIPKNPLMPWQGMGNKFAAIRKDRLLFFTVVGYVYFWFVGALARQNMFKFAEINLMISEDRTSYLLAAIAIGIGVGALLAGYLSRGKVELGLIPVGALGMTLFSLLLGLPADIHRATTIPLARFIAVPLTGGASGFASTLAANVGGHYLVVLLFSLGLGMFAGMFGVPLAASIQKRAPKDIKGGVIATVNMLTFIGIALSSLVFLGLESLGFSAYSVFGFMAASALGIGGVLCAFKPIMAIRMVWWCLDGTLFKLKALDRHNIPEEGGALLVCNHESFVDAMALQAAFDREVYFVVGKKLLSTPWLRRCAQCMYIIPVDENDEQAMTDAVAEIHHKISQGHLVCVNRSKQFIRDGCEVPWYQDYTVLTQDLNVPIIPVAISRLWEVLYVFREGRIQWRFPKVLRFPIHVFCGEPVSEDLAACRIRDAVQQVNVEGYMRRSYRHDVLQYGFISVARRFFWRMSMADLMTGKLNYFKTLVGTIALARKFKPILGQTQMVAILMPPTIGGALANLAVQLMGRIPVNLNYTASNEIIGECAERCKTTHTITSRAFLERVPLTPPGESVFLEDIKQSVSGKDRVAAMLMAVFMPKFLLLRMLGATPKTKDDIATVIFSSGSEGIPKGVVLTHRNITTVIEGLREMFPHDKNSCLVGFLPFFHSFGFSITLWAAMLEGLRGIYHPNPLEPKPIGQLIKKYGGSIMISTPTFLQGFIRRCEPEQMLSLDCVITGAEKLPDRICEAFRERFSKEPMEGYGTTECAPVVSVNVFNSESPGFYLQHCKHNTIGRPFPYQLVKIVDPGNHEELPVGEPGLLMVKGPNIMAGYLNDPERTAKVLHDGWYETGDIAAVDEDGFIIITDRLARFSKIGGEMIPHNRIEECLHTLLELTEQTLIVAGVADESRGERLVVLHTLDEGQLAELKERLKDCDLPNLWRPRPNSFYHIDAIPVLGTGKMDIRKAKQMAIDLAGT
jgi:acyl-[acyl-carrier-protein]-phospholipid O-acyltransferase / long-chain-fatty-acid--[acyl-carrier-protein] ligase